MNERSPTWCHAALAAALLLAASAPLPAQAAHRGGGIGIFTAVSHAQLLKTRRGHSHDRDLYMVGVRWSRPLAGGGPVRLEYTADALPAVVSTAMPEYGTDEATEMAIVGHRTVYGFGVQPLGLQLRAAAGPRLALLARGAAGPVWFQHRVPEPAGTRLNFALDLGAGVELSVTHALRASAGFRFDHISNGGFGRVNPGMNSHMLELGVSLGR